MAAAKYSSVQQVHLLTSDEPSSLHRSNEVNGRDSRPTKKAGRRNNRSISGALTIWWLESLLLLLMLATLAAICITTWRYQNKPVPKWPHNISVNTLNAVFGVILKTNIVVVVSAGLSQLKWTWYDKSRPLRDIEFWDQASRGPWGSLLLIWRLRGRHIIATIGALILILTLALDPFIQLLVLYNNCLTTRNDEQATVPIRHSYSESNGYYTTGWFVPTALGHAANAGILGAANTEIAATCQTGNCTFDEPYHTIAFCSQCQDISDSVSISCGSIASDLNTTVPECVVGVPGGFNNTIIDDDGGWETLTFSVQDDRHITGPNLILLANNLTDGPEVNPQKFQQCSGGETDDLWLCRGYGAANCSIVPCVQTFTARVDNGRLQESYRGAFTEMLLSDVGNTYSALNVKCLPSDIRDQLIQQLNYPIDATMEWIGYRGTDSNGSSYYWNQPYSTLSGFPSYTNNWTLGPLVTVPSECIYEMSTESSNPAQEYIAEIATGNVTTESAGHEFVGNVIPTALFNSGNISFDWINSSFASMATAMSVYLRQATYIDASNTTSTPDSTFGVVHQIETCMRVRWVYILYPAILVAITLIFFIGMILETFSRDGVGDWKDSALALVFHGLINPSGNIGALKASEISTREDMNKTAEKMLVSFSPAEHEMSQVWSDSADHVYG